MADCFISYSSADELLAQYVYKLLVNQGLNVFMAALSLSPGDQWGDEIRRNLSASQWVIFLATAAAVKSPYVQQELGMAMNARKKIIPITWKISPGELPGWMKDYQAVDLRGATMEDTKHQIAEIAEGIQRDKIERLLFILALIVAAILAFYALQYAVESRAASNNPGP